MNGVTTQLLTEIAAALNARNAPPVKCGIQYRILVFKVKDEEKWITAMIPDFNLIEELFDLVNESYSMFLTGVKEPNGISFICSNTPEDLIRLSKIWYYEIN